MSASVNCCLLRLPRFEIVGKANEDIGQLARFGGDGDETAVEIRERARQARERGGERRARGDLRAHAVVDARAARASSAWSATAVNA